MATKKKGAKEPTDALADATPDEQLEAQQEMLDSGKGAGTGYVGTMSADERAAEADRLDAIVNHDSDSSYTPRVAPAVLGRHEDAEIETDEGEEIGVPGSRVGFTTVLHPRAGRARAMHDWLDGAKPSELTSEELSGYAEKVGMSVEATGANGQTLKSDLVRAFDDLAAEYPAVQEV